MNNIVLFSTDPSPLKSIFWYKISDDVKQSTADLKFPILTYLLETLELNGNPITI